MREREAKGRSRYAGVVFGGEKRRGCRDARRGQEAEYVAERLLLLLLLLLLLGRWKLLLLLAGLLLRLAARRRGRARLIARDAAEACHPDARLVV